MKAVKMIAALGTAAVLCTSAVIAQADKNTAPDTAVTAQTDTQNPSDIESAEDELLLIKEKEGKNEDGSMQPLDSTETAGDELPLPGSSTGAL